MNHYITLGIKVTATADEIKKAYRKLALEFHPDRNNGDKKAAAKFRKIAEAYEVLGDEKKRKHYDQFGAHSDEPRMQSRHKRGPFASTFDDFFESQFTRGGRTNYGTPPPQLADIYIAAEFTLEEIAIGGIKYVEYKKKIICDVCRGVNHKECKNCHSTGQIEIPAQGSIELKPGAKQGMEFRAKELGHTQPDGTVGDLVIKVNILPHPIFEVQQMLLRRDLKMQYKIDIFDVLLKNEVEISTLYGPVKRKISFEDIAAGFILIKNYGLPEWGSDTLADLSVHFELITPKRIPASVRKLLEKVKDKLNRHHDKDSD